MLQQPVKTNLSLNGISVAVYRWNQHLDSRLPLLVLTHATGFHARCWNQVIARLGEYPVLAMDMRGHGESEAGEFSSWKAFTDDLSGVLLALGVENALSAGHSMGAYCSAEAAARHPGLFSRLLLIDPVIMSPEGYQLWNPGVLKGESQHFTTKRRANFDSVAELKSQFGQRTPYCNFDSGVFEDYCRFALKALPDGRGMTLACSPGFEGRIYDCALGNGDILEQIKHVQIPVAVVRAMQSPPEFGGFDFRYSPTWPLLANQLPQGTDLFFEDETHFLPLESPQLAADLIRQHLLESV